MQIPPVQLEKFKNIYKQEFGIELTDQEAEEEGMKVLILMKAIYRPIPKDMFNRLVLRDAEYNQAGRKLKKN